MYCYVMQVVEGIPNATAAQLDVSDGARLRDLISEVPNFVSDGSKKLVLVDPLISDTMDIIESTENSILFSLALDRFVHHKFDVAFYVWVCVKTQANVVISLLPANCHIPVANACIEVSFS